MAKGSAVRVVFKSDGPGRESVVTADKAGRKVTVSVEKDNGIPWLVVRVLTRGGTEVFIGHHQLSEVVSYTESKALEEDK